MSADRFRWRHDTLVVDNTIVGCISEGASGHWFSYGCMDDWEDTPLGCFEKKDEAMSATKEWAENNL